MPYPIIHPTSKRKKNEEETQREKWGKRERMRRDKIIHTIPYSFNNVADMYTQLTTILFNTTLSGENMWLIKTYFYFMNHEPENISALPSKNESTFSLIKA